MLDNYEYIASLINRYNNGTISSSQREELDAWIKEDTEHQSLFDELTSPAYFRQQLKLGEQFDKVSSWKKIEPYTINDSPIKRLFPWKKIGVAASILLVIGLGSYFLFFNKKPHQTEIVKVVPQDVEAPKGTKAMITLADGRIVSLDSLQSGTLAIQDNTNIIKTADGKIIYQSTANGKEVVVRYNTLNNPRGSPVIDMQLIDGSHVWLNAGSSVTYPEVFVENERKVTITGEAYFEVVHDVNKPFYVSKGDMTVQVLGTHFNVNAYDDEAAIKVTLLEGSVRVNNQVVIKPGQQARILSDIKGDIKVVSGIDTEQVMAWKNGIFKFNKTDLKVIMRDIARWYDVEVSYEGNIPEQLYNGDVARTVNVSEVLKILEYTGAHFKIEGKKIIVLK